MAKGVARVSKMKAKAVPAETAPATAPGQYVKPEKLAKRKVAIVGFCGNTRHLAADLYGHPDFEQWGLNRGGTFQVEQHCHRWFETHSPDIYGWPIRRHPKHIQWLANFKGPVYLHQYDPQIPNSITYPLKEVAADVMRNCYRLLMQGGAGTPAQRDEHGAVICEEQTRNPYLSSTIAYQIGLAIHEGFEEIHLYGIDLNTDSEYAWQKDGVEFLIGVAAARGIKVVIPDDAALLKGKLYGRGFLKPEGEHLTMAQFEVRKKTLEKEIQQAVLTWQQAIGRRAEMEVICEEMPPGLSAEKLNERLKALKIGEQQAEAQVRQLEGRMFELAYWISTTPEGQDPRQAIKQIEAAEAVAEAPAEDLPLAA